MLPFTPPWSTFSHFRSLARRSIWALAGFALLQLNYLIPTSSAEESVAGSSTNTSYLLDAGDVINIYVYEEEELSLEVEIGDSGTITYPLLGEVKVRGLTTNQLDESITRQLIDKEYLISPDVSINIVEYRPFYIEGEVEEPGAYPFESGLTLRRAVSLAGGFTERASRTRITILSDGAQEANTISGDNALETPVKPGDVITVRQSFF